MMFLEREKVHPQSIQGLCLRYDNCMMLNIWCNLISQTRLITKMIEILYVSNPTAKYTCRSALPLNGEFRTSRWSVNVKPRYCWWTKSFTTKDDVYSTIRRVLTIPGGCLGFCPSTTIPLDAMSLRVGEATHFCKLPDFTWTCGENLFCFLCNLNWAVQARGVEKSSILRFRPYFWFICRWHKPSISHSVGKIVLSYNRKVCMIFVPISLLAGGCQQIVYL